MFLPRWWEEGLGGQGSVKAGERLAKADKGMSDDRYGTRIMTGGKIRKTKGGGVWVLKVTLKRDVRILEGTIKGCANVGRYPLSCERLLEVTLK